MDADNVAGTVHGRRANETGPKIIVAMFAVAAVGFPTLAWNAVFYRLHGSLNPTYFLLSLFLSINLLICFWEACLYLRRDYIEKRAGYWRERRTATGRSPAVEFLTSGVPLRSIGSPTVWADVCAAYSVFDDAYTDRRRRAPRLSLPDGRRNQRPPLVSAAAALASFCFRRNSRSVCICCFSASGTMKVGMSVCWLVSVNV